jgi:hypothetical protein
MKYFLSSTLILFCGFFIGLSTNNEKPKETVFIWNDDLESIPADNELIKIEFTQNDTIYLTNKH